MYTLPSSKFCKVGYAIIFLMNKNNLSDPANTQSSSAPGVVPQPITPPPGNHRDAKTQSKPIHKIAAAILLAISIFMAISILFVSSLQLSSSGFFGAEQTPWLPAYYYLLGIPVLFLSVYRMWRGFAINSLFLFVSVPTMYSVVNSQLGFNDETIADMLPALLLGLVFVVAWTMLVFKRNRLAFLVSWPFITTTLTWRSIEILDITRVQLSFEPFLIFVLSLAAWVAVIFWSSNKKVMWTVAVTVVLFAFVVPNYVLRPSNFVGNTPDTKTNGSRSIDVPESVLRSHVSDGVTIKQIEHGHYFDFGYPVIQRFGDSVLIPYKAPGSSCADWWALNPDSLTFSFALLGEKDYCSPIEHVAAFHDSDLVAYWQLGGEFYIQKISSGEILLEDNGDIGVMPVLENDVFYYVISPNSSTGANVYIRAFDTKTGRQLWEQTVNKVHHPRLPDDKLQMRNYFISADNDSLILQLEQLHETEVVQLRINKLSGEYETLNPLEEFEVDLLESYGYFYDNENEENIPLLTNFGLQSAVTKLSISGKEIALPEPCWSPPILSDGYIVCLGEKYVNIIDAKVEKMDEGFIFTTGSQGQKTIPNQRQF